jgi:hypothetical protein
MKSSTMDEMKENQDIEYTNRDLAFMMQVVRAKHPVLFNSIKDEVYAKPTLTDFEEIPDVIHFVEINEEIMDSFLFMPFREKIEFMRLAIAVIIVLYAPAYFDLCKYTKKQANLPNGLRAAMAKYFGYRKSHSIISDHVKTIRGILDIYPSFKSRVYNLADEYRDNLNKQD